MFKLFGKSDKKSEDNTLEIEVHKPVDCLCDFTYNFHWQHKGEKLDPSWKIPENEYTFGDLVEHLKNGGDVKIKGDTGHRLGSSMGVDLKYFGGKGEAIDVGNIIVDGNVDTRMGISMIKGQIYVKGTVKGPMGNLVEVVSDKKGYKKFKSITDIVTDGLKGDKLRKCQLTGRKLTIEDGINRDTVGARLNIDAEVLMNGNADLSTGILMRRGSVKINGNAGKNTGALLNGGTVVINGNTDDFTGVDMIKGTIIVNGDAGKFMAANRKGGKILARKGKPIPPTHKKNLNKEDRTLISNYGFIPLDFVKFE